MPLKNQKAVCEYNESGTNPTVMEETLSDNSKAYNVRVSDTGGNSFYFECEDQATAAKLAESINALAL